MSDTTLVQPETTTAPPLRPGSMPLGRLAQRDHHEELRLVLSSEVAQRVVTAAFNSSI